MLYLTVTAEHLMNEVKESLVSLLGPLEFAGFAVYELWWILLYGVEIVGR